MKRKKKISIDVLELLTEANYCISSAMLDFEKLDEVEMQVDDAIESLEGIQDFLEEIRK